MGLIAKIKEFFNKNIECGDKLDNRIVYLHRKKYIYLNKNILVGENSAAVVVYRNKVTDVIFAGKYRINQESIPETYARAKIAYKKSKNYRVKHLRADVYFVKTSELVDFKFFSDEPFYLKSKNLGKVQGYLEGYCNLKILDPQAIIRALIFETGYVKDGTEYQDIGLWVGNKVKKTIEKNKIPIDSLLTDTKSVDSMLNANMEFALDDIGLFASNIRLKALDFPKKYQGKVNKFMMQNKKNIKMPSYNQDNISNEKVGALVTKGSEQNAQAQSQTKTTMQNPDNSLKITKFIRCNKCGTNNMLSAHICTNCGNKLD